MLQDEQGEEIDAPVHGGARSVSRIGEILIRGATVFPGYEGVSSEEHFVKGFFRTGDVGFLDSFGFLTVCDRAKVRGCATRAAVS